MSEAEDAPQFAEALLGFRVWVLGADGWLRPLAVGGEPWAAGENRARCMAAEHEAPHPHCGCGFNALHRPPPGYAKDVGHAVGAIAAWGEVDLFQTGFRAEYASILALAKPVRISERHRERLARAARTYGVPLVPLGALVTVGREFARAVALEHLPGRRTGKRRSARPVAPLPKLALCSATAGNGVWLAKHVALAHRGRTVRLGPTPALAAAVRGRVWPVVGPYEELTEGDPLFRLGDERDGMSCPAPLAGRVIEVRGPDGADLGAGPGEGGWLVELEARPEPADHWPVIWGVAGADAYRQAVIDKGSDARLLDDVATNPGGPGPAVAATVRRAWLGRLCDGLNTLIVRDRGLADAIDRLGLSVGFGLLDGGGIRVAPAPQGAPVRVVDGGLDERVDVCFELEPQSLIRYWRGTLSLAWDQVSSGPFITGRFEHVDRRPVHLSAGSIGQARLAMSIHRRLFPGAAELLDELGEPWFRAGDAVRDPARNRAALAGRPSGR